MDPATVSIVRAIVGWLKNVTLSKTVWDAWEKFLERSDLQKETTDLIEELRNIELPVEPVEALESQGARTEMSQYLKEIKELVNEGEDLLDELDYFRLKDEVMQMNSAERHEEVNNMKPNSSMAGSLKELELDKKAMSKRINSLISKLKQTRQSLKPALTFELLGSIVETKQTVANQSVPKNRPETNTFSHGTFYGRDTEIKQILDLIKHVDHHTQKHVVVTIVGDGGVGKTALAEHVYKNEKIRKYFNERIWTCMPHFDVMAVTRQMLERCGPDKSYHTHKNPTNLKSILKEHLQEKNVLLVIDDIWEVNSEWHKVLALLDTNAKKVNMVLVTTRDPSIAKTISTTHDILGKNICLDGWDDDVFRSLFKSCAFGDDSQQISSILEETRREIANRLKGYPLAAKTVWPLLKANTDVIYRKKNILESEEWKSKGGIIPALKLSYEHLPIHLQPCFSYCYLFPKRYYFKAEELVNIWMALDFLHEVKDDENTRNKRIEDVGLYYLKCLVERGFFQPIRNQGPQEYYVIPDLMHYLAQIVREKECFSITHHQPTPAQIAHIRHLSILYDDKDQITCNSVKFENLRSLIVVKGDKGPMSFLDYRLHPSHYLQYGQAINVRLLVLPYSWPYQSTSFLHLRYLKIHLNYQENIPVEICRLYHLEVLELTSNSSRNMPTGLRNFNAPSLFRSGKAGVGRLTSNSNRNIPTDRMLMLPTEFKNLINLRNFIAPSLFHSGISEVGRLKHLQELKSFGVRNGKGFELEQLAELEELRGSLQIFGLKNVKSKKEVESVKLSKKAISCLTLSWSGELHNEELPDFELQDDDAKSKDILEQKDILEVLQPNGDHLEKLGIWCYQGCESTSWLAEGKLKYLEFICLYGCEAWEVLPNFGQLECLKKLYLMFLPKVKAFDQQFHGSPSQEGFPSLKLMVVRNMAILETWQCGAFPSLEKLEVRDCPELSNFTISNIFPFDVEGKNGCPELRDLEINNCPKLHGRPSTPDTQSILDTNVSSAKSYENESVRYTISGRSVELKVTSLKIQKLFEVFLLKNSGNIKSMHVESCPNLEFFFWDGTCLLDCLQELTIKKCPKLFLSPGKEADDEKTIHSLKALQKVEISECGISGDGLIYLLKILPALRELSITSCHEIKSVSIHSCMTGQKLTISQCNISGDVLIYLLKCLPDLRELSITSCSGIKSVSIPIHTRMTVRKLTISQCDISGDGLICLLKCLPDLRELSISSCYEIKSVSIPSGVSEPNYSMSQTASLEGMEVDKGHQQCIDPLVCLEELYIRDCPNMVLINDKGLSGLTSLKKVTIHGSIELLDSMNPKNRDNNCTGCFPVNLEELIVGNVPPMMDWSLTDLNSVHTLKVDSSDVHVLMLRPFVSLRKLELRECRKLVRVRGPESPVCLEVYIENCPHLASPNDIITEVFSFPAEKLHIDDLEFLSLHAKSLSTSLRSLIITGIFHWWTKEEENALIKLTALKELTHHGCFFLSSLPGTLDQHPSLEELTIVNCPLIKSLPRFPTSLQKLNLGEGCSEELRRYCSQLEHFECTNYTYDQVVFVKKEAQKGVKLSLSRMEKTKEHSSWQHPRRNPRRSRLEHREDGWTTRQPRRNPRRSRLQHREDGWTTHLPRAPLTAQDVFVKKGAQEVQYLSYIETTKDIDMTQQTEEAQQMEISETWVNRQARELQTTNVLFDYSIKYLVSIHLSNCETQEELPNFGQLMCLKRLHFSYLSRVKALGTQFHGCGPHEGFPSLRVMQVWNMDELETWEWSQQPKVFPSLEEFTVEGCPKLRKFSFLNFVSVHGWFPKLTHLKICHSPLLQQVVLPEHMYTTMVVIDVTMVVIVPNFGSIKYSRSNKELTIQNVSVPEVLDFIIKRFKSIYSIAVKDCQNLTSLPWKSICMLDKLKRLEILECPELCLEIQPEAENDQGQTSCFRWSLQELQIDQCGINGEEISYLLAHVPLIHKLSISNCHKIDSVSLHRINNKRKRASLEAGVKNCMGQKENHGSLKSLEELSILNCPKMYLKNKGSFSELTLLRKVAIHGCQNLLCSMEPKGGGCTNCFPANLEELSIGDMPVKMAWLLTDLKNVHTLKVEKSNVAFLNLYHYVALKKLKLVDCRALAEVRGPNSHIFPEVIIQNCSHLASTYYARMRRSIVQRFLMPVQKLHVDNIEFLLFHANSFSMSLRILVITAGYIVGHNGSQLPWTKWTEEQENVLIRHLTALENLTLERCINLCSLPGMLYQHPSLKELTIYECPEIKSLPRRGFPKSLQKLSLLKQCNEELKSQYSLLEDFECSTGTQEGGKDVIFVKKAHSVFDLDDPMVD